jgi:hypothetical protein
VHLHTAIGNGRSQAGVGHRERVHGNLHRCGQIDTAKHDAGTNFSAANLYL